MLSDFVRNRFGDTPTLPPDNRALITRAWFKAKPDTPRNICKNFLNFSGSLLLPQGIGGVRTPRPIGPPYVMGLSGV